MARMTDRQIAWWNTQPEVQTCSRCGATGTKSYVQPQPRGGALCATCITAHNTQARAARKAELAAMARCEVSGCTRRGSSRVGTYGKRFMCGHHLRRAQDAYQAQIASHGVLGLFEMPVISGDEALQLATA